VRRGLAIAALALAFAGCGSSSQETASVPPPPKGDFGPTQPGEGKRKRPEAPPLEKASAAVAQALAAGTVGVVGVEGDVGVRPASLDVSADGTLQDLRWKDWGESTASATGALRLRDCDPTCAGGGIDTLKATIKLSSPRLCGRATYFDHATVEVPGDEQPATYVRAPC
jgi:hypothetical protein